MRIKLDFRSNEPIYVQIAEQIRQMVASGELKKGDQLPTVRQLATELRVNFNTVARSYRLLDESGLISTQQGRGTFIWEKPSEDTLQRLRQHGLERLTANYLFQMSQLGFTPEEVHQTVAGYLDRWREQGEIPDPESDLQ
jgi:GntR family transcriptional regulator